MVYFVGEYVFFVSFYFVEYLVDYIGRIGFWCVGELIYVGVD